MNGINIYGLRHMTTRGLATCGVIYISNFFVVIWVHYLRGRNEIYIVLRFDTNKDVGVLWFSYTIYQGLDLILFKLTFQLVETIIDKLEIPWSIVWKNCHCLSLATTPPPCKCLYFIWRVVTAISLIKIGLFTRRAGVFFKHESSRFNSYIQCVGCFFLVFF